MMILSNSVSAQWVHTTLGDSNWVDCFAVSGPNLFAGPGDSGIYLSTDNGINWRAVDSGLTDPGVQSLYANGANLFAGTHDSGVYLSTNEGASWSQVDSGLFGYLTDQVFAFAVSGTNLFAGTGYGIYLSSNNGTSWSMTGFPHTFVRAFAVLNTNLFAVTNDGPFPDVYLSTDSGTNWMQSSYSTNPTPTSALALIGTNLFAGGLLGVFRSTDSGSNWVPVSSGLPYGDLPSEVTALAISGTNLFAGTDSGIYLSTDNGANWTSENRGLTDSTDFSYALAVNGRYIFAGTTATGVWRRPLSDFGISAVGQNAAAGNFAAPLAAPNPASDATTISFSTSSDSYLKIEVFDVLGNKISSGFEGTLAGGNHAVPISLQGLESGVYYAQIITSEGGPQTLKLVKE
jgi:photosystem II stability/assembly factor-like uncharacterized protein